MTTLGRHGFGVEAGHEAPESEPRRAATQPGACSFPRGFRQPRVPRIVNRLLEDGDRQVVAVGLGSLILGGFKTDTHSAAHECSGSD
jgi:hypothetical protein